MFSNAMEMRFVKSSVLRRVGYDEDTQVLRIEFQTGAVYDYIGVPWIVADQLLEAPSAGDFFNELIGDIYAFEKPDLLKSA